MKNVNDLYAKSIDLMRMHCLMQAQRAYGYDAFKKVIDSLSIDISDQYTGDRIDSSYLVLKLTNQHAFQAFFTRDSILNLINNHELNKKTLTLVDIGDSAGNHIKYQKELLKDYYDKISGVSVNLDPVAVEKCKRNGGEAVLCRAEDYCPGDEGVDVYLSYEMVEHLHNPALFFHRLAKANNGKYMIVTVPFVDKSRVALWRSEHEDKYNEITAEVEHIFEFSPIDWKKLIHHSGWKIRDEKIYYQYPRNSVLTPVYKRYWRKNDFEGFYGLFLERDMTVADKYTAWED